MKKIKARILLAASALILLFTSACIHVEADEIGVVVRNVPVVNKVIHETRGYGYHFYVPRLYDFYKLPRTHMTIEMAEKGKIEFKTAGFELEAAKVAADPGEAPPAELPEEQLRQVKSELSQTDRVQIVVHDRRTGNESVRVKTADGNDAWVDVIVTFHILPESAYLVVEKVGVSPGDIRQFVTSMVRGMVQARLSELDSKEILRAQDRNLQLYGQHEKGKPSRPGAMAELNRILAEFGLEIINLSLPRVAIHPDYEAVLSKKRVAEEEREEYLAHQLKAEQEMETKVNKARGESDAMIELAKGRLARAKREADAELEAKKFEAFAVQVKFTQLANGIQHMVAALAGPGGDAQVGLAIAQAMQGKTIVILPGQGLINALDLNELFQSFGAFKAFKLKPEANPHPTGNPEIAPGPKPGQE